MNRLLINLLIAICAFGTTAQTTTWFPYPTAPENMPYGRPRANYLVEHFWDRCPWKSAYSSNARMQETLHDFATYLPHAAQDTVLLSIDTLIKNTQKKPADLATLLKLAEGTFYSDTTTTFSEFAYMPFANAGATFKKFKPDQRAYYARQVHIISNSMAGNNIASVEVSDINGNYFALNDTTPGVETYIFYFERTESDRIDRVLFAGNISVRKLVEAGLVQPVLICAGEPDESWWESTKRLPDGWKAVAMPNAENEFDIKTSPSIFLADSNMKIISSRMPLNLLRINCEQLVKNIGL